MARRVRRKTFWRGIAYNDVSRTEDSIQATEILDPTQLDAELNPTLVRVVGRLVIGSTPQSGNLATTVTNFWWGLRLAPINAGADFSPHDDPGYEGWIITGFMKTAWVRQAQIQFDSAGLLTGQTEIATNMQGPWEMSDFDGRAMRKAQDGDSLLLVSHTSTIVGNPETLTMSGIIRTLWKAPL